MQYMEPCILHLSIQGSESGARCPAFGQLGGAEANFVTHQTRVDPTERLMRRRFGSARIAATALQPLVPRSGKYLPCGTTCENPPRGCAPPDTLQGSECTGPRPS